MVVYVSTIRDWTSAFAQYDAIELPTSESDILPIEAAGEVINKIEVGDLRSYMQEGVLDHVRVIQHGTRTAFGLPTPNWQWNIQNHPAANNQIDKRRLSLVALGPTATADAADAWWRTVFGGGTARVRLATDTTGDGVSATCPSPARGIRQGEVFYLYDITLDADLTVTAADDVATSALPVTFSYLQADVDVTADTMDFEGATVELVGTNVAKVTFDGSEHVHGGAGIDVEASGAINIAPPPYVGGFWGNGSFGRSDVEVLRGYDLTMRDERSTTGVDLYWSKGWSIGIDTSGRGIQMNNDQEHNLGPVDGLHPSLENPIYPDVGNQPAGEGRFGFRDGALVWSGGTWPTNGIDMTVEVTFSDFASDSYLNLTLTTSNNDLWGSARTPDRGQRFNGAGGTVKDSHRYELRPSGGSLTTGTTVQLHLEAILHGNPSNNNPVGRFRSAQVTFHYNPSTLPVAQQEYDFGLPAAPSTSDPPVGNASMIPLALGSHTDVQNGNHLSLLGSIFSFSRDLRNVLLELISQNATTQPAWQLEVWTRLEGIIDWHLQRTITMPGPKAHSSSNPAYHFYYDLGPVLNGQEFAHVARGLTGSPSVSGMGSGLLKINTNTDTRFPSEQVLARGLITTESVATVEQSLSSGTRTYAQPAAGVERWLRFQMLCADNNGNQHAYSFDVATFRFGDASKQMTVGLSDPTALDARMAFSRNPSGTLTLSTRVAVRIITAYLELEA